MGPGAFVAVPPNIVHTFANDSGAEATWLNFHAPDMGFASYLRAGAAWDSFDAPADGGLPAGDVRVSGPGERRARGAGAAPSSSGRRTRAAAPRHAGARWTFAHARGVLEIRAPD